MAGSYGFFGALLTVVVLFNYTSSMVVVFTKILLISTLANLVTYLCCALAALKLAWQGDLGPKGRSLGALVTNSEVPGVP